MSKIEKSSKFAIAPVLWLCHAALLLWAALSTGGVLSAFLWAGFGFNAVLFITMSLALAVLGATKAARDEENKSVEESPGRSVQPHIGLN